MPCDLRIWFDQGLSCSSADAVRAGMKAHGLAFHDEGPVGCHLLVTSSPDQRVAATVRSIRQAGSDRVLVVILAPPVNGRNDIWSVLAAGADDVLEVAEAASIGPLVRSKLRRWDLLAEVAGSPTMGSVLVGSSLAIRRLAEAIAETAMWSRAPVLVTGEPGTGKELVAGLLHTLSPAARNGRAVLVDCSTLHSGVVQSELFGHESGAFTGASTARDGAIVEADGGTLFLDEVGELPAPVQAHLLRVLQEGQVRRVGGNRYRRVDMRVVAATNRALDLEVRAGRFREDLYHRLRSIHLHLPPLRDRREDIPDLVQHFLKGELGGGGVPPVSPSLLEHLCQRDYPGNVRELRQLLRSILLRAAPDHRMLSVGHLPEAARPDGPPPAFDAYLMERAISGMVSCGCTLKQIERSAKEIAIRLAIDAGGRREAAAAMLDVSERTLQNYLNGA